MSDDDGHTIIQNDTIYRNQQILITPNDQLIGSRVILLQHTCFPG